MALEGLEAFFTRGLSPFVSTIIITAIIALSLPLFLHFYLYRSRASTSIPTFLLIGPSGAGKTSLATLFDRGAPTSTHTSQTPLTTTCALPAHHRATSARFRSAHDPTSAAPARFHLRDTPGHGKLRHFSLAALQPNSSSNSSSQQHGASNAVQSLKGIIFVVDSAALASPGLGGAGGALTEAAEYLYDVLAVLQRRHTRARTARDPAGVPVLVAANKMDLFTALPQSLVRTALEREVGKVRETRGKGLLDSGVDMGTEGEEEDREWLGGGEGEFRFEMMEECEVSVKVVGGNVLAGEGEKTDVEGWWEWIAENM
ncbi:MAG: hypothetical protein M1822_004889 [Bathelium mastoideum]|nr:MAG: hypothetical protein M1822_004889 [Bathelium mastoideum]